MGEILRNLLRHFQWVSRSFQFFVDILRIEIIRNFCHQRPTFFSVDFLVRVCGYFQYCGLEFTPLAIFRYKSFRRSNDFSWKTIKQKKVVVPYFLSQLILMHLTLFLWTFADKNTQSTLNIRQSNSLADFDKHENLINYCN